MRPHVDLFGRICIFVPRGRFYRGGCWFYCGDAPTVELRDHFPSVHLELNSISCSILLAVGSLRLVGPIGLLYRHELKRVLIRDRDLERGLGVGGSMD